MPITRISAFATLALAALLAGCVSFGKDPPETLFDLTAVRSAAPGSGASGTREQALSVLDPQTPAKLSVLRVPVQVDDANIAYLTDAQWVEKPARLFGKLLEETIRAKGTRLVVDGPATDFTAATKLSGQLLEMGYDAPSGSVVVRYDAVLQAPGGAIRTRRFESVIPGVSPAAGAVAPALNRAANDVASQVAEWVG